MEMKPFIFYLSIALIAKNTICDTTRNGDREQLSSFLKDFVEGQESPTQVILFICCKIDNWITIFKNATFPIGIKPCNNFTSVNEMEETTRNKILFVIDLQCPHSLKFIQNSVNSKYFAHPYRWLMFAKNFTFIPKLYALPDSNIYLTAPDEESFKDTLQIKQFYKIEENSSLIFEIFGRWNKSSGLIVSQFEKVLSKRRGNLQGKVLTASIVITNNDTLNHLNDYGNKQIDAVTKTSYLMTKHLIDAVNGTLRYITVNTWGYPDPKTGKYNGMIGDLLEKRADIGGTVLFYMNFRIPIIEYISMTTPTRAVFIFRKPPLSYVSNIYSLPFTDLAWICGIGLVTVAIIVIFFTIKYQRYHDSLNDEKKDKLRLTDFILNGISVVCQMGISLQPKLLSARISTIFLLIAVLFLYTSYTANIVALLQSTTKTIASLSDILNSQLELAVDDNPYNRYYFPAAREPVRRAIYEKKILKQDGTARYTNMIDGIARMRKGFFAFHVEEGVGYKLIEETFYEHEKCNLMTIQFIEVVDPWFSIQKNSPYKEMLKVNLFKIREYGMQARVNGRIYTKKPVCATIGQSFESVRINDCYAALVILAIGYGLGIVVLIFENCCKNFRICLI